VSTEAARAVREAVPPQNPDAGAMPAEARRRAKSIPASLPAALSPGTGRNRAALARAAVQRARVLLSGPSLLHSAPPTVHENWTAHLRAAAHHDKPLLRVPRLAWGCFHTLVKVVLDGVVWVTHSPARLAVACLAGFLFWLWI
jgi:hypothetical protein